MGFARTGGREVWAGRIATVREDTFRFEDGSEVEREVVSHPGAVAIVALDGDRVWMVRQPREAVEEQSLLEIPAGKLDVEGEPPEAAARRELAEEIGKGASEWRLLTTFYNSPGLLTERTHLYLATALYDAESEADEDERIEVVSFPLADLDLSEVRDAKSLVGLLWARALTAAGPATG